MKSLLIFSLVILSNIAFCQLNNDSIILKNKVKEVREFNSKNKLISIAKYNEKGKLIFSSNEKLDGSLKTSKTITYNEKGEATKIVSTHSSFSDPTTWLYEYDDKSNVTKIKDENGNLIFEFFYDNSGFKVKQILYEKNEISEITTYESKDDGKRIIQNIKGNFIENRENISYFDDNKNEIKSESYDFGKLRFSCDFIYKDGNKIKVLYHEKSGESGNNFLYDNKNRLQKRQLFDVENGEEILGASENFEYFENDLIKTYTENIYSIKGENSRFEYDFYK